MPTRLKHLSEQESCSFGSPPGTRATPSTGPDEEQALLKNIS